MSDGETSLAERLRYLQIDAAARADLAGAWAIVEPRLPGIMRAFYAHLLRFPASASRVSGQTERLAEAQVKHWRQLFVGGFDEAYARSATAIGHAHVRVGVEPGWFLGAYGIILAALVEVLGTANRFSGVRLGRLVSAVTKATMLDMQIAVSVYHEALMTREEERRHRLAEDIRGFDGAFGESLCALNAAAQTMREAAARLGTLAGETAAQAATVSGTAEEMATRTIGGVEATRSMAASIETVEAHARRSLDVARRAVEQAQTTDATVRGLAAAAERIGSVVELITGIAGQTNLLALNATIEAARAGDAGLGFTVVAREVKALATQTASATKEIADQIAEIQAATRRAVGDLAGIGSTIDEVAASIGAIATAVEDQSLATRAISATVQEMSADAGGVAAAIAGVQRATESTDEVVGSVQALATRLDDQAGTMEAQVRRFFERLEAA
jgi:methyl-accepting chemotaxis protein